MVKNHTRSLSSISLFRSLVVLVCIENVEIRVGIHSIIQVVRREFLTVLLICEAFDITTIANSDVDWGRRVLNRDTQSVGDVVPHV